MAKPSQPSQSDSPKPAAADRVVRKRLADGTIKEYRYPRESAEKPKPARWAADSLNALLMEYTHSPDWKARKDVTNRQAQHYLKPLWVIGHYRARDLKRREVLQMRNGIFNGSGPAAANSFIKEGKVAFRWAIENELVETSPFENIKRLEGGEFTPWTEEQVTLALAKLPEPLRRVVVLAVHTSQRRSDLIAMRWAQIAGGRIRLTQIKTDMPVSMPIHPQLAAELQAWRAEATQAEGDRATFVLVKADGERWKGQALSQAMKRALNVMGISGINVHGLRKRAATRLAEAGCTAHEIAAITGHASIEQVQHYTEAADRERLATAAVSRLKPRRTAQKPRN